MAPQSSRSNSQPLRGDSIDDSARQYPQRAPHPPTLNVSTSRYSDDPPLAPRDELDEFGRVRRNDGERRSESQMASQLDSRIDRAPDRQGEDMNFTRAPRGRTEWQEPLGQSQGLPAPHLNNSSIRRQRPRPRQPSNTDPRLSSASQFHPSPAREQTFPSISQPLPPKPLQPRASQSSPRLSDSFTAPNHQNQPKPIPPASVSAPALNTFPDPVKPLPLPRAQPPPTPLPEPANDVRNEPVSQWRDSTLKAGAAWRVSVAPPPVTPTPSPSEPQNVRWANTKSPGASKISAPSNGSYPGATGTSNPSAFSSKKESPNSDAHFGQFQSDTSIKLEDVMPSLSRHFGDSTGDKTVAEEIITQNRALVDASNSVTPPMPAGKYCEHI